MPLSAAETAAIEERRAQLIALRRLRVSFEDPRILGLGYNSSNTARKDFYRAVVERKKATEAEVDAYREEQTQIIQDLLDVYLPQALGNSQEGTDPDPKAAELCLKLLERDSKLNGYEAALKAELSGPGGGAVPIRAASINELRDLIRIAGDPDEDDEDLEGAGQDAEGDDDDSDDT
ncbi:hypothetical protein [Streptomyces longwoodensis]|uniref:hypothetical protein n=1 Tax=Streptomyces longwoodensis TaxID=68231 RepID=UPI0022529E12|nr:hypothetical protein [Streptomyces longwoodensis]MCX5001002.1 hypothetical protein [Streptomyces longwoodensis]